MKNAFLKATLFLFSMGMAVPMASDVHRVNSKPAVKSKFQTATSSGREMDNCQLQKAIDIELNKGKIVIVEVVTENPQIDMASNLPRVAEYIQRETSREVSIIYADRQMQGLKILGEKAPELQIYMKSASNQNTVEVAYTWLGDKMAVDEKNYKLTLDAAAVIDFLQGPLANLKTSGSLASHHQSTTLQCVLAQR